MGKKAKSFWKTKQDQKTHGQLCLHISTGMQADMLLQKDGDERCVCKFRNFEGQERKGVLDDLPGIAVPNLLRSST